MEVGKRGLERVGSPVALIRDPSGALDLGPFGCRVCQTTKAHFISGRALRYFCTLIRNIFSDYQLLYLNIASRLWGALSKL